MSVAAVLARRRLTLRKIGVLSFLGACCSVAVAAALLTSLKGTPKAGFTLPAAQGDTVGILGVAVRSSIFCLELLFLAGAAALVFSGTVGAAGAGTGTGTGAAAGCEAVLVSLFGAEVLLSALVCSLV